MKKIHLLILVFVLIVLLGIILYRLWLLGRIEGATDDTLRIHDNIQDPMKPYLKYWYSFNTKKSINNINNKIYNWANQQWDAEIVQDKGQISIISTTTDDEDSKKIPGLKLDKANNQYIKLPNILNLEPSDKGLSFTGIFKQTSGGWARLFDFGNGPSADNIGFSSQNGAFVFRGNGSNHSGLGSMQRDKWVKFAWTLDPINKDPTKGVDSTKCIWTFYKNGEPYLTREDQNYPNAVNRINNFIGKSNWSNDEISELSICEFRIYNTVLNKEYIQNLHNYPSLPDGDSSAPSASAAVAAVAAAPITYTCTSLSNNIVVNGIFDITLPSVGYMYVSRDILGWMYPQKTIEYNENNSGYAIGNGGGFGTTTRPKIKDTNNNIFDKFIVFQVGRNKAINQVYQELNFNNEGGTYNLSYWIAARNHPSLYDVNHKIDVKILYYPKNATYTTLKDLIPHIVKEDLVKNVLISNINHPNVNWDLISERFQIKDSDIKKNHYILIINSSINEFQRGANPDSSVYVADVKVQKCLN